MDKQMIEELEAEQSTIDIAPTILDIAGIPAPATVDGIAQQPLHGTSFKGSLSAADAPDLHTQQYFESVGNRACTRMAGGSPCTLPASRGC